MESEVSESTFPIAVTLRFQSEASKQWFMGGLSDGFGENYCSLTWADEKCTPEQVRSGEAFDACKTFGVVTFDGSDPDSENEIAPWEEMRVPQEGTAL